MAALLGVSRTEMLGIMKDSNIPLNYGVSELDEDIETAKTQKNIPKNKWLIILRKTKPQMNAD